MSDLVGNTKDKLSGDADHMSLSVIFEPRCEKTGLPGFRPGLTQTGLYSH